MIWCARGETHHIKTVIETPVEPHARTSLLRYSPALVLVIIAIADIQRWADPDLWGHVAFGRAMLATFHLTLHDPYSYSAPGHLWLNHEWLSELLMGAIYNALGVVGLKLMKFSCSAAVILFLTRALAETDSPITPQLMILLAASVAIAPQMQFRPQIITFAMMSGLMAILTRYTYRGKAPLSAALLILLFWANLHGGFIVGLGALGTFSAVRLTKDIFAGRGARPGMILLAITAASAIVTMVTPYGIGTWHAVGQAIANPHTREVISDWQPLTRSFVATWREDRAGVIPIVAATAMFASLAVTWVLNPRRGDLAIVAVAVVMIVAALVAMRNLPLAVIATVIALTQHSSSFFRRTQPEGASRINQILIATIGAILLISTGLLSSKLRGGDPRPVGAMAFMRFNHLSGNVMSDFGWGEYVIWHMAPASKVFIDGRYDTVYPPGVIDDYLGFQFGEPGAKGFLRKYPHDFILLQPGDEAPLASMASAREWTQLYRDGSCILFVRRDSAAAKIPPVAISPRDTPPSYFP
jgi:hypothetical protein